jgi:hypothetical protein
MGGPGATEAGEVGPESCAVVLDVTLPVEGEPLEPTVVCRGSRERVSLPIRRDKAAAGVATHTLAAQYPLPLCWPVIKGTRRSRECDRRRPPLLLLKLIDVRSDIRRDRRRPRRDLAVTSGRSGRDRQDVRL